MPQTPLSSRLLIGALAGLTATTAMTATMRRLYAFVSPDERYPLPPREITERVAPPESEGMLRDTSLASHFAYGAAVGALIAAAGTRHRDGVGALLGIGVWAASYLGWIPAVGILKPAHGHPLPRNALMIGAHLVWGAATTWSIRELAAARDTILAGGPLRDAPTVQAKEGMHERR